MITFRCGGCGHSVLVLDEQAGKKAKCPKCGQVGQIPTSEARASLEASPPEAPAAEGGLVKFFCLYCGKKIGVKAEDAGQQVRCPKCSSFTEVPREPSRNPAQQEPEGMSLLDLARDETDAPATGAPDSPAVFAASHGTGSGVNKNRGGYGPVAESSRRGWSSLEPTTKLAIAALGMAGLAVIFVIVVTSISHRVEDSGATVAPRTASLQPDLGKPGQASDSQPEHLPVGSALADAARTTASRQPDLGKSEQASGGEPTNLPVASPSLPKTNGLSSTEERIRKAFISYAEFRGTGSLTSASERARLIPYLTEIEAAVSRVADVTLTGVMRGIAGDRMLSQATRDVVGAFFDDKGRYRKDVIPGTLATLTRDLEDEKRAIGSGTVPATAEQTGAVGRVLAINCRVLGEFEQTSERVIAIVNASRTTLSEVFVVVAFEPISSDAKGIPDTSMVLSLGRLDPNQSATRKFVPKSYKDDSSLRFYMACFLGDRHDALWIPLRRANAAMLTAQQSTKPAAQREKEDESAAKSGLWMAKSYEDMGRKEKARELYVSIVRDYPHTKTADEVRSGMQVTQQEVSSAGPATRPVRPEDTGRAFVNCRLAEVARTTYREREARAPRIVIEQSQHAQGGVSITGQSSGGAGVPARRQVCPACGGTGGGSSNVTGRFAKIVIGSGTCTICGGTGVVGGR